MLRNLSLENRSKCMLETCEIEIEATPNAIAATRGAKKRLCHPRKMLELLPLSIGEVTANVTPPLRTPPKSWSLCDGECCDVPLHRNRTCAFGNLLFRAGKFHYLREEEATSESDAPLSHSFSVFLHSRFQSDASYTRAQHMPGIQQTLSSYTHEPASRFAPSVLPPSAAAGISRVIETPIYIGSDVRTRGVEPRAPIL